LAGSVTKGRYPQEGQKDRWESKKRFKRKDNPLLRADLRWLRRC